MHACPYPHDYVCACSHRIQGRGLDPLELGLLVVSYSIWVLGNALGSSGLPSQDALIKSMFLLSYFGMLCFYRNLILSRPASDFCVVEGDFESLTLLPPPTTHLAYQFILEAIPFQSIHVVHVSLPCVLNGCPVFHHLCI